MPFLAACGGAQGGRDDGSGDDGISITAGDGTGSGWGGEEGGSDGPVVEDAGLSSRVLRQLTRQEYKRTVEDLLGVTAPSIDRIPKEPVVDGFDNNAYKLVVTTRHVDEYMSLAAALAETAIPDAQAPLIGCDASSAGCPQQFVETFGRRALRRPLAEDEVQMYLDLFDPALTESSFVEGARLVVRAMLVAPEFLYRVEIGEPVGDGLYRLTPHEIASALSYLYWGTMPDDELFALAESGELAEYDVVVAQAERLLDDPRGQAHIVEFVRRYLGTQGFLGFSKDAGLFPEYTDSVRTAMQAEEEAFIQAHFGGGGTWADLFTPRADLTDASLQGFYRQGGERGTLLTLGTVLASHSLQQETSPVRRGLFIREKLLCQHLPDPPADVEINIPALDPNVTTRARYAQHSSDPFCAGCHRFIDGIGFAFEGYDTVGRYRTQETNGMPVDTTGVFTRYQDEIAEDSVAIAGPDEILALLEGSEVAQRCLARRYFRYARGLDEVEAGAEASVEAFTDRFLAEGTDLRSMLLAVVKQRSFIVRQGEGS